MATASPSGINRRRAVCRQLERPELSAPAAFADISSRGGGHSASSTMLTTMANGANVVRWLIAEGAALDRTGNGLTALMLALVRTALDLAAARGPSDVVALLQPRKPRC